MIDVGRFRVPLFTKNIPFCKLPPSRSWLSKPDIIPRIIGIIMDKNTAEAFRQESVQIKSGIIQFSYWRRSIYFDPHVHNYSSKTMRIELKLHWMRPMRKYHGSSWVTLQSKWSKHFNTMRKSRIIWISFEKSREREVWILFTNT